MNTLILSLFEGSLLCDAGIPVNDMYACVKNAYRDSNEVYDLFESLEKDWRDPNTFMKMIAPFEKLKQENRMMVIAYAFTQLAAGTGMVDVFWGQCGYAYSLAKKVKTKGSSEDDCDLAKQLLQAFQPDHEIWSYFLSLSHSSNWQQIKTPTEDLPNLKKWALSNSSNTHLPLFRCHNHIVEACKKIEALELSSAIEEKWKDFVSTL